MKFRKKNRKDKRTIMTASSRLDTSRKESMFGQVSWVTAEEGGKCNHNRKPFTFGYIGEALKESLTVLLTAEWDMDRVRTAIEMPDLIVGVGTTMAPFPGALTCSGLIEGVTPVIPDTCQATTDIIHLAWIPKHPYPIAHLGWAVLTALEYLKQGSTVEIISPSGHNRLAVFAACLAIVGEELTAEAALAKVRKDYCPLCLLADEQAPLLRVVDLFAAHVKDGSLWELFDWLGDDVPSDKPNASAIASTTALSVTTESKGVVVPESQQLLLAAP